MRRGMEVLFEQNDEMHLEGYRVKRNVDGLAQ